jgi:hypothetical protein
MYSFISEFVFVLCQFFTCYDFEILSFQCDKDEKIVVATGSEVSFLHIREFVAQHASTCHVSQQTKKENACAISFLCFFLSLFSSLPQLSP